MEKKEIIVCIDVQKFYANYFSYSYLKKLLGYLNKRWKEGIEIISLFEPEVHWEEESLALADVPTQILDLSSKAGYKFYESQFKKDFNEEFPVVGVVNEPTRTIDSEGNLKFWFHNQQFIYLSPILEDLITHDNEVVKFTLVGGGRSKCVSTTQRLLLEYGFEVEVLEDMCYEIRHVFNSTRKENAFRVKPANFPAKYLNSDGMVSMSTLKRDDFVDFIERKLTKNTEVRRKCG